MTAHLNLVGIVTTDMTASLAFYRRLGLDIPAGVESEPHVEITLDSGLRIAWDTVEVIRSFDPDWQPPTGGQRLSLAFLCDDPAGVDALAAELADAGGRVRAEPWDAFWGQRYAVVEDPDGLGIDLFAPLA